MIFLLLILLSVINYSNQEFLTSSKIYINGDYYSIASLNEPCIVDNSSATLPLERGIGLNNCESGLTCFNFHCIFPSEENQPCEYLFFKNITKISEVGFDRSNCTSEFYCHPFDNVCKKTKEINEKCENNEECINILQPNSTCYNGRCTLSSMVPHPQNSRYFFIFFFLSILIYIYYRQYTIQEAQLNRLNELAAQGMLERRCDPEIETLPPYSPPSSTFLAENENDNTHSLISPPSYHQFPTVDISPQGTMINTSTTNSPNILTDSILHSINVNTTNNSITTANRSTNQNLLSANPRLSFISTQSSLLIPNTPPPSYSQPTTPYLYDIENENGENNNTSNNDDNDNEALLPPIPTNSNVTQPPVAHPHNNSRTYNLVNNVTTMNVNRYSTLSNPEDRSDQNNNNSNRSSYRRSTISLRRSSLRHSITLDSNSNINLSMESSPPPH